MPSANNLETFHRDGCVVLPDVFTDKGPAGLTNEILSQDSIRDFFKASVDLDSKVNDPYTSVLRP